MVWNKGIKQNSAPAASVKSRCPGATEAASEEAGPASSTGKLDIRPGLFGGLDIQAEESDDSDIYAPGIETAQVYSSTTSEDEANSGKRKKAKLKRAAAKRSKQSGSFTVKKTVKFSKSIKHYEFYVPELNHPGARFVVPEEGVAGMAGLKACEVKFEMELSWSENHMEYNTKVDSCDTCRFCTRPRCGLCAGCNGKPGFTKNSAHDECHWRRCPFRKWKSKQQIEKHCNVLNDTVIIRTWIYHVNTFCLRGFDAATKRAVRRRLQLYNMVLNLPAEEERRFWLEHAEAFSYPRLNIERGDKFHTVYKNLEIARYRVAMHTRETKIQLGLDPDTLLDDIEHKTNLQYRERWPDKTPVIPKAAGSVSTTPKGGKMATRPEREQKPKDRQDKPTLHFFTYGKYEGRILLMGILGRALDFTNLGPRNYRQKSVMKGGEKSASKIMNGERIRYP